MKHISLALWGAVICLIIFGCGKDPSSPGPDPQIPAADNTGGAVQVHHCLGWYLAELDKENLTLAFIPVRSAQLHANLVGVLNATMGVTAVGVPSEHDPPNGIFTFDVTLTHPYGTRPNLTGFDVKGILIGTADLQNINGLALPEQYLLNADGYTRWWNAHEFTDPGVFGYTQGSFANLQPSWPKADLNSYKYFADALLPTDELNQLWAYGLDDPQGRGVFSAGASNTRRYRIRFPLDPNPVFHFGYAVDASWAPPSVKPPEVPDDFPIEANQPECYYMNPIIEANSLCYDSESGIGGGALRITTVVRDWQGQLAGDTLAEIDPFKLYCPAINPAGIDAVGLNVGDAAVYFHNIDDEAAPTAAGTVPAFLVARAAGQHTYDQGLGYSSPQDYVAAYKRLDIEIVDPPCEADSNNGFDTAADIGLEDTVTDFLCSGTDNDDYYILRIPYGTRPLMGFIYSYSCIPGFRMRIYDSEYKEIFFSSGAENIVYTNQLGLVSGTYYIRVSTVSPTEVAATYNIQTTIVTEDLETPNPTPHTPGDLDMDIDWISKVGTDAVFTGPTGIWIYNMSDPSNPALLARYYNNVIAEPAVSGNYMYFFYESTSELLGMLDFTDLLSPAKHDDILTLSQDYDLITAGESHLFLYESDTGDVDVFEFETNPASPEYYTTFTTIPDAIDIGIAGIPTNSRTSLAVMSDYILKTYLVTDLDNITENGSVIYVGDELNWDLYTEGALVLISNSTPIQDYLTFYQIDMSTLLLTKKEEVEIDNPAISMSVELPYLVFTNQTQYTRLYDIYQLGNIKHIDTTSYAHNLLIAGGRYYSFIDYHGFEIRDVSEDGFGDVLHEHMIMNNPALAAFIGDIGYFYTRNGSGGDPNALATMDFSPSSGITITDKDYIFHYANSIVARNDALFIAFANRHIESWSLADPLSPSYVTELDLGYEPVSLALNDAWLYVTSTHNSTLETFNVDVPSSITLESSIAAPNYLDHMIVHGGMLYGVTTNFGGYLLVYDLTDPANPVEIARPELPPSPADLAVRDEYLYVLYQSEVTPIDISDPHNPVILDSHTLPAPPDMEYEAFADLYLYCGSEEDHPYATSLADPANPEGAYEFFPPAPVLTTLEEMYTNGEYLMELTQGYGMFIWDLYD